MNFDCNDVNSCYNHEFDVYFFIWFLFFFFFLFIFSRALLPYSALSRDFQFLWKEIILLVPSSNTSMEHLHIY